MKVKQMFKQQRFFRQPTGCITWQHTPKVLCGKWLNLEVAVGFAVSASKCSLSSSKRLSLPKRFPQRCPHDGSVWFAPPLRAIKQRLAAKGFRHNLTPREPVFDKDDAKREPGPETWRNQWTSMQNLTDMAMVLFFQYQHCNISRPMRLQFLWKDGREILALKASLRISLVMVWNHLESTCNARAWNPQRLEQRARLQQLCRYRRDRTKITRSSRWSLCRKVSAWKTSGRRSSGSWWSRQPCVSGLL